MVLTYINTTSRYSGEMSWHTLALESVLVDRPNRKVLLRDRKRRTARDVASLALVSRERYSFVLYGGTSILSWLGYPLVGHGKGTLPPVNDL